MKKYFEYIGLFSFALFSFYFTDKVTAYMNSKDPVMKSILEYKEKTLENCKEGYITSDGVVLGLPGREVNARESYSKMQGEDFNADLMVFDEILCKVNKENTKDNYIINANPSLNKVALFIYVDDYKYIDDIINVFNNKNVKVNIIMDKINNEFINKYNNIEIIYTGNSSEEYNNLKKINKDFYCMSFNNEELNLCKDNIKLKTNYYFYKNILLNTKKSLEKGSFYVYKENKNTLDEITSVINFIKGKNIEIDSISNILN